MFKLAGDLYYFLSLLNPVLLIYGISGIAFLSRFISPSNRSLQSFLKAFLFLGLISIIIAKSFSHYISIIPSMFILKIDWFSNSFFGSIERGSIPILLSILFIVIAFARDFRSLSLSFILRFVLHVGAAVGVLFARDAISMLFYLEIVVIVSAAIVMGERNIKRSDAISYASLHILSGVLMLVGMLANANSISQSSYGLTNNTKLLSSFCTAISIAISIGLPPFSFLFVDIYGSADSRNTITLVPLLSKLTMYTYISIMNPILRSLFIVFGFIMIFYSLFRVIFQRSLKKIVLLGILVHSATILFFMSDVGLYTDGLLKLYIGISMLTSFLLVSLLRVIDLKKPSLSSNILLLSKIKVRENKEVFLSIFFIALLLVGLPGSLIHFSEEQLIHYSSNPVVLYGIFASNVVTSFIFFKILFFSFFETLFKRKKDLNLTDELSTESNSIQNKKKDVNKNSISFSRFFFFSFVSLILFSGFYFDTSASVFFDYELCKAFKCPEIIRYFMSFGIGMLMALILNRFTRKEYFSFFDGIHFASIMTEFCFGLYEVLVDLLMLFKGKIDIIFNLVKRFSKIIVRKGAIGEFSSLYSTEAVICIAILIFTFFISLIA